MTQLPALLAARYQLASDMTICVWSSGIVREPRRSPVEDWRQTLHTIDDQRIFGPLTDYRCACGDISGEEIGRQHCDYCGEDIGRVPSVGLVCDICGCRVMSCEQALSRGWGWGHIELQSPVRHPWDCAATLSMIPVLPRNFRKSLQGIVLEPIFDEIVVANNAKSQGVVAGLLEKLINLLTPVVVLACEWNLRDADPLARGLGLATRSETIH